MLLIHYFKISVEVGHTINAQILNAQPDEVLYVHIYGRPPPRSKYRTFTSLRKLPGALPSQKPLAPEVTALLTPVT